MMEDYRELNVGEIIRVGDQFEQQASKGEINWLYIEDDNYAVGEVMSNRFRQVRRQTDVMILSQKSSVIAGMKVYGGGFMSSLGLALTKADKSNTILIYQTWPTDWQRYNEMGKTCLSKD